MTIGAIALSLPINSVHYKREEGRRGGRGGEKGESGEEER